ncbi:hypothetical protein VDGD_07915 [Verticillium dahliae]|nr:hypothetical protein VDGD_07915 [Verticillium dahliae]
MESIARISDLLESARELTLDAASAARSSRASSRPLDRNQIKKLLDSRNDREILEGLRRVISVRPSLTIPLAIPQEPHHENRPTDKLTCPR